MLNVQAFNNGKQMAHSGMNASALYLFDRLFSLAKVWVSTLWQRIDVSTASSLHFTLIMSVLTFCSCSDTLRTSLFHTSQVMTG